MDALDTSRAKATSANMSCCGNLLQPSDSSARTAAAAGPAALDRLSPLLRNRRVLIVGAIALAIVGIWAGWGWVVALGVAPLILAIAPCLVMCALGFCMMGRGMGGQASGGGSTAGQGMAPGTIRDPVSLRVLLGEAVASAVYQGRPYYFESRENRDAFESDPTKYLSEAPAVNQAVTAESASIVRS